MKYALIALLVSAALSVGGCALFGDMAGASAAFNAAKENFTKAGSDLKAAADKITEIKAEYDAAVKAGDKDKASLLLAAGTRAVGEYQIAKQAYDSTDTAIRDAIQKVNDAEGAQKYGIGILTLLGGLVGAASGALGGRYPLVGKIADLTSGIFKTMAAADTHLTPDGYQAFAKAAGDSMTPAELAVINKAAGGNAVDPSWVP